MQVPGKFQFEAFVEAAQQAVSKERLFELFIAAMAAMGFDQVNFSIIFDAELAPQHWGFGLISTYPLDWQGYYVDKKFYLIDPVRRRAWGLGHPFWWRDILRDPSTTTEQSAFLREGDDAGLHNGLGIPFRGPPTQRAGVALATSIRRLIIPADLGMAVAIANHIYTEFKRICKSTAVSLGTEVLNETECDILTRAAHGRKDHEIAKGLGLAPSTINWHFRNIFVKLNVNGRSEAVAYAIHNGIIQYNNASDYRFR